MSVPALLRFILVLVSVYLVEAQLHPSHPSKYQSLPSLRQRAAIQDRWTSERIANIPSLLEKYGVQGWLVSSSSSFSCVVLLSIHLPRFATVSMQKILSGGRLRTPQHTTLADALYSSFTRTNHLSLGPPTLSNGLIIPVRSGQSYARCSKSTTQNVSS